MAFAAQILSPGWIDVLADASFASSSALSDVPIALAIADQESPDRTVYEPDEQFAVERPAPEDPLEPALPDDDDREVDDVPEPEVAPVLGLLPEVAVGTHSTIPGCRVSDRVIPFAAASGRM